MVFVHRFPQPDDFPRPELCEGDGRESHSDAGDCPRHALHLVLVIHEYVYNRLYERV